MKNLTYVYLIRHSEQLKIENKIVENEDSQINNEKIILSVEGEKKAEEISELTELSNIDVLWSSNYVRAISTAKYIACQNKMKILMKENYGDLKLLRELGKIKQNPFTTEQLLDENLKNVGGENRLEVTRRMEKSFYMVLSENIGKRIAIVSHGASIKFLLMKWCKLNDNNQLEYNHNIISLNSPGVLKLTFENKNLIDLVQIV